MKTAFYVESYGRQVEEKALIAKIKEIWVAEGNQDQRHQGFKYLCKT